MNLNRQFLFGALTGVGGLTLKTILNIVVYPAILSSLGGTKFGLYVLLLGLVELLIAMDLGFTSGLNQRLSTSHAKEDPEETRQFLSTGLVLYLIITALVLMTTFLVPNIPHFLNIDANLIDVATFCFYIIVMEGALTLFQGYFAAVLQSKCKYQCVNTSETLYYFISNGGIFILLSMGMGLKEITILRFAAAIVKFALVFYHCVRTQPGSLDFTYFNLEKAKNLLQISMHSLVKNVSDIVAGRLDLIIISKFLTLQDVGLYAFTYRFLNLAAEFPVQFSAGVYPIFTRLYVLKEQVKSRLLFLRLSSVLYLGINFLVLILLFFYIDLFHFFAKENINLAASWPVFLLAIPGVISATLYLPANHFLFAAGRHRYVSTCSVFMAVAKVTACVTLVKLYGLPGVVLSTILVRCTFHQLVIIRKACQDLSISLLEYMRDVHLKIIPPVLAAALIIWLIKSSGLFTKSLFLNLLFCTSTSFSVGFAIWFMTTASDFEMEYVTAFLTKIRTQLRKPKTLETPS
jgi:O-antigen/teichoic acid export membrane protein